MVQSNAEERPEQLTQEQRDSETYAYLVAKYGQDPEFMADLARAWRLGFIRHSQLGRIADHALTINPFWL